MIRRWLIGIGLWLARRGGWALPDLVVCPRPHVDEWVNRPLVRRAAMLCTLEDCEHPDHGQGEVKRHRVYARLMKEYPHMDKRTLAFAIELAQQERVL